MASQIAAYEHSVEWTSSSWRVAALLLIVWTLIPAGWVGAATPEQIKAVAQEMVCLCGNCNRESLATCICSDFAVPQRQEIGQLLDAGKTHKEIVDLYIQDFGSVVLAAPPSTGYNLLAWIAPFAVLLFGIVIVRSVVRNWRRGKSGSSQALTANSTGNFVDDNSTDKSTSNKSTADYQTQLRQELEDLDEEV
jgi:cytochrome c-type biogenesis protein CcmH